LTFEKEAQIFVNQQANVKPLIQKLPLSEQTSFVARTYTTPLFETTWHQHEEIELILQLKGRGLCFIGNYIGDFSAGEVFLLGSNLPHEFKKEMPEMECSVMVVHFNKNFWGEDFWNLPEADEIKRLLQQSTKAVKISGAANKELATNIKRLEQATGFERISLLCSCLLSISRERRKQTLSTLQSKDLLSFSDDKISKVFEYTIGHFDEPISLETVSALIPMSVSAFCRYFKRATKKTYVEFVNEIRIGHACHALLNSDKTVLQIAYDSGFNTVANFNKQFLKLKEMQPSVYKRKFSAG
jgi:AraC-like DNA-binding protein